MVEPALIKLTHSNAFAKKVGKAHYATLVSIVNSKWLTLLAIYKIKKINIAGNQGTNFFVTMK